jgi:hypothetical protein
MENLALLIHSDGRVRIHKAIDANLKYKPDLSHLPFDYQVLPIVIDAFGYATHEIELTADTDHTGYEEEVMPAHWIVLSMSSKTGSASIRHTDHSLSQLVFQLDIRRNWRYFFWRIFFPMTLIVAFSWSIVWLAPDNLAVRIELGIIFLLTIMAFSLGFSDYIPKISYLTFLDSIFISMLLLIFFSGVESIVANHLCQNGKGSSALALDRYCRIFAPASILLTWVGLYLIFFMA